MNANENKIKLFYIDINIKKANEKSASKPHRKDFINEISDYASNE